MALSAMKDHAILLSVAHEYLCETVFLRKLGNELSEQLERLREQVGNLKKRFVGIPATDVDVETPMAQLAQMAALMTAAEKSVIDRCRSGQLGEELWEKVRTMVEGVDGLRAKIEGMPAPYGLSDLLFSFGTKLRSLLEKAIASTTFLAKLAVFCAIGLFASFLYLFLTMEDGDGIRQKISACREAINAKQTASLNLTRSRSLVREEIDRLYQKEELTREEKVELIYLNLKAHKMLEEQEKLQLEVELETGALKNQLERLEGLRKKSFLQRLLRQ
jgi:protein tyrosine phosphatase (PTP) superfamily phosphohydrolase (DUF442 family)